MKKDSMDKMLEIIKNDFLQILKGLKETDDTHRPTYIKMVAAKSYYSFDLLYDVFHSKEVEKKVRHRKEFETINQLMKDIETEIKNNGFKSISDIVNNQQKYH